MRAESIAAVCRVRVRVRVRVKRVKGNRGCRPIENMILVLSF